ncbi:MAG: ATP-binding protein [Oribacterium sp.]|nr:ATP-binding protein [Oribacterium sp.]
MFRKFQNTLEKWDQTGARKPMMVIGARQTGKTWTIRNFCENHYQDYIYLNLEEQADIRSLFDGNLDPDTILRGLEQMLGRKIAPDTPLVMDEIQSSERAITALKYFCEDQRHFRIICAGSLLGVKIHRFQSSFPVGKVQIENLYPMDFEEFLLACGEDILIDGIQTSFTNHTPLPDGVHNKALRLYHDYLITGGMPEVICSYLEQDRDVFAVDGRILSSLQLAYLADMTKYVTSPQESVKITETYRSVPRQLAKENPKFKYNEIRQGVGKRDFWGALDWLNASGLIIKVDNVELPVPPLRGYDNPDSFKIYLSDVGLLTNLCGLRYRDLLPDSHNIYKGGVIENYVYQQIQIRHPELYYFKPSESMEIDMLIDDGSDIIPVEIKAGRHRRSTSLRNYREKYKPPYAIRFSEMNFGLADGLLSVPLYAAFCV